MDNKKELPKVSGLTAFFDKIPRWAGLLIAYATFTFSGLYASQGLAVVLPQTLANMGILNSAEIPGIWFYFFGGLGDWIFFELVLHLLLGFVRPAFPSLDRPVCVHYARLIFGGANILIGMVGIVYFFVPLLLVMGKVIVEFLIWSGFAYLFYYVISRRFLPNFLWGRLLKSLGFVYIVFQAVNVGSYFLSGGLI